MLLLASVLISLVVSKVQGKRHDASQRSPIRALISPFSKLFKANVRHEKGKIQKGYSSHHE